MFGRRRTLRAIEEHHAAQRAMFDGLGPWTRSLLEPITDGLSWDSLSEQQKADAWLALGNLTRRLDAEVSRIDADGRVLFNDADPVMREALELATGGGAWDTLTTEQKGDAIEAHNLELCRRLVFRENEIERLRVGSRGLQR